MPAKIKQVVVEWSSRSLEHVTTPSTSCILCVACVLESFHIGMCSSTIRKKRHLYLQRCVVPNDSL